MELPEGKSSSIAMLNIDQFTKPVVADKEVKTIIRLVQLHLLLIHKLLQIKQMICRFNIK